MTEAAFHGSIEFAAEPTFRSKSEAQASDPDREGPMLNIAICDDNAADLSAERACLEDYFRAHPDLSGQVRAFPSGEALLEAARETSGLIPA